MSMLQQTLLPGGSGGGSGWKCCICSPYGAGNTPTIHKLTPQLIQGNNGGNYGSVLHLYALVVVVVLVVLVAMQQDQDPGIK